MARIEAAELVALDTETTSLDEMVAEIVGLSFSVQPGEAIYIPLAHNYADVPLQLPRDELRHAFVLRPLAEIAPDFVEPRSGRNLAAMWASHPDRDREVVALAI